MKQTAFELAVTIAEEQLARTRAAATITLSLAVDIFLTAQYALRVAREGDALPPGLDEAGQQDRARYSFTPTEDADANRAGLESALSAVIALYRQYSPATAESASAQSSQPANAVYHADHMPAPRQRTMSSPQLYAITYGRPGYIQTQTLSHNQTADDVSASFAACPMPTRDLLFAMPQDRHYQRASDIPMTTGSDAISFSDWNEAQGITPAPIKRGHYSTSQR